jgi:hypothetical protein
MVRLIAREEKGNKHYYFRNIYMTDSLSDL